MVKNLPAKQIRTLSLVWEDPWSRKWQPTPVFLFREFHGQRSLDGYSLWDHKELDTTERLTHTHTHTQCLLSIYYNPVPVGTPRWKWVR